MTFSVSFNLSALNGTNGFAIDGVAGAGSWSFGDSAGRSAGRAGDINNDGIGDVIIGAPGAAGGAGAAYVVFGRSDAGPASIDLSSLGSADGLALTGAGSDLTGSAVAGIGDVNGDGIDDIAVGAPGAASGAGETYVIFGTAGGFTGPIDPATLDGSAGIIVRGAQPGDLSGRAVAGGGDVNGDGIGDLIIGAYGASPDGRTYAGTTYVIFGATGLANVELSNLESTSGFAITGGAGGDVSGFAVAGGDINGDTLSDIIIGAYGASPDGRNGAGEAYVVFGRSGASGVDVALPDLDGGNGFAMRGIDGFDSLGFSVASAGDINGDGIADLIMGAPTARAGSRTYAGESYVVFGSSDGFDATLDLASLDGSNGFVLNGDDIFDVSGFAVSGAGDVNGDGLDDLLIGAQGGDPNNQSGAGQSYLVFGSSDGFAASLDLSSLDGFYGIVLNGALDGDLSGEAVSAAGDVNGDGVDDLLVGAPYADPGGRDGAGSVYVVFGQTGEAREITGTRSGDSLAGRGGDDTMLGYSGDDSLSGGGGNDTLGGGAGNDSLAGDTGNDTLSGKLGDDAVFGGDGDDSLIGNAGDDSVDGGAGRDTLLGGDGADVLTGGAGADRFRFAADASGGTGADVITDFSVAGNDRIAVHAFGFADFATLEALFVDQGADTLISLSGVGGRDVLVEGVALADLDNAGNFIL